MERQMWEGGGQTEKEDPEGKEEAQRQKDGEEGRG